MNLVIITALIAVCGAAKLDRTYLPPASAKTAGGSPGSLQTPLQNSIGGNNGLGGLPKGSFTNEFDAVVVDAAAAGTRASENEASGLGAPRIAYGSTNSKVGAAAFKTNENAFPSAPAGINFQSGNNFNAGIGPERQRAQLDRSAQTLRFETEVGPENYHYAYETDNGISAEENGVATNGVQAQGGFSYTGDDGQVYSVSYTADEGGYQPKGDHLPTPPPIPEEILKSLEQNAKDEAAGLVDDGSYDAQKYNTGGDYSESDDGKYSHQSSKFEQADATPSSSFINQNNQPFRPGQATQSSTGSHGFSGQFGKPQKQIQGFSQGSEQSSQSQVGSNDFSASGNLELSTDEGQSGDVGVQSVGTGSKFGQGQNSIGFGSNSLNGPSSQTKFTSSESQSTFASSFNTQSGNGNRNEYLPPVSGPKRPQIGRPQNNRLQSGRPQNQISQDDSSPDSTIQKATTEEKGSGAVALSQQKLQDQRRPQGSSTSFGQSISGSPSGQSINGISSQAKPTKRPSNVFAQGTQSSQPSASFGDRNEYLPPTSGISQNKPNQPGSPNAASQYVQQSSQYSGFDSTSEQENTNTGSFPSASFESQSTFGSQQINSVNRPQSPSSPTGKPSSSSSNGRFPSGQNQFASSFTSQQSAFDKQKPTNQPDTELTTPLEPSEAPSSAQSSQTAFSGVASFGSRPSAGRPFQSQFGNISPSQGSQTSSSVFGAQSSSRQPTLGSRPFGQTQAPAFPTQTSSSQFSQQSQFSQPAIVDTQAFASTQRPSFIQQSQGVDESYYYNQPSKPFGTPQASRFPSAPSNQFNQVTQGSSFTQNSAQFSNAPQDYFSNAVSPQKGQRYPQPPTVAPTSAPLPTQSQYQSQGFSGITQASISPFPSQAPTQSSQFNAQGQLGLRPSSQFGQPSRKPSFGQQATNVSKSQAQRPTGSKPSSFQIQSFEQVDLNQNQPEIDEASPSVATQQYNGEIYEYNKPPQTLPAPEKTKEMNGQFGQNVQFGGQSKPQVGQDLSSAAAQFTQSAPTNQPNFGAQASRPQFGQTNFVQSSYQQSTFGVKPEYGQPPKTPFGQPSSQSSFGTQGTIQSHSQSPQFGQTDEQSELQPQEIETSTNQFGFGSPCCQSKPSSQSSRPGFGTQYTGMSFGTQPAGTSFGAQSTGPSFGAKPTGPSFGAQPTGTSFGSQPTGPSFGAKPTGLNFGAQSTGPSFEAKPTGTSFSSQPPGPSFGAKPTGPSFGNQPTGSSFGAQTSLGAQPASISFGAKPAGSNFGARPTSSSFGAKPTGSTYGARPTGPSFAPQPTRPSFGAQSQFEQGQFGAQSTAFTGAQNVSPKSSSLSGQGEVFDPNRKPPASSFDADSGYHY